MPLPDKPDVADLAAEAILAERRKGPIFRDSLAQIIRGVLAKAGVLTAPAAPEKAPKPGQEFGDRKKIPPTPEQVAAYSASIGYPLDGQAWCDSYAQKGWTVGKAKMKDWQAAVRTWKINGYGLRGGVKLGQGKPNATL